MRAIGLAVRLAIRQPSIRLISFAASCAVVLWSSSAGAAPPESVRLVVRMKPWVAQPLDRLVGQRRSLDAAIPGSRLDRLNRVHDLRTIRPLRRADATLPTMKDRRAAEGQRRAGRGGASSIASIYVLELAPGTDAEAVARDYAADPAVEWAEPDGESSIEALTNDPFLASVGAWGQDYGDLWGVQRVSAPAAWDVARGAGVVIAISDTGIDPTHPDLAANVWQNPGEIPGNGVDDDGNGYVDDVHGWNFIANTPAIDDDNGHGTHVAGTAAAVGNNGAGIVGIAFESRVMAVKGLSASGHGLNSELAEGIVYAAENGARVINASWGGVGNSQVLNDALAVAYAAGVVFVTAAGNSDRDVDAPFATSSVQPAHNRHAITVAAADHLDQRAFFSNFGAKIDVTAPGGGDEPPPVWRPDRSILSLRAAGAGNGITGNGASVVAGNLVRLSGTSMAAPHVTGAAAVVLSLHPEYHPEQVRQALRVGADDVDAPGWDIESGYGRLNVAAALGATPLAAHMSAPRNQTTFSSGLVPVTGDVFGPGFVSYVLEYAPDSDPDGWAVMVGPVATEVADGTLGSVDVAGLPEGNGYLRLRAVNGAGASFEDRLRVRVDTIELTAPVQGDLVSGIVAIQGSISPYGFQSYAIEYRRAEDADNGPWRTAGITLSGSGLQPVQNGVLATFDTTALGDSTQIILRAVVQTTNGTFEDRIRGVTVSQGLRAGWPQRVYWTYTVAVQSAPTVVDLDGDGTKEILVAYDDLVHVFRPDGSYFPGWPQQIWSDHHSPFGQFFPVARVGPSAADLDGDGQLEIVTTTEDLVFVFRADGTLLPGWPVLREVEHSDAVLADLDGDDRPEIIVTTAVVPGGPTGAFPGHVDALRLDGGSLPGFPVSVGFVGKMGQSLAVGDVDGDGDRDIVITMAELPNRSTGRPRKARLLAVDATGAPLWTKPKRFSREPVDTFNRIYPPAPILADVDGDARPDIVIGNNQVKRLRAYRGDGGRVRKSLRIALPPYHSTSRWRDTQDQVVAGDVTGDGIPELVVATNLSLDPTQFVGPIDHPGNDFLSVMTPGSQTGNLPGWPHVERFNPSNYKDDGLGKASIGDIDGDGVQEIVVANVHCDLFPYSRNLDFHGGCQGLLAFRPDGSPVPGFPKATPSPAAYGSQAALADLDGDGLVEIVWLGAEGQLAVWNVPGTPGPERFEWPMARHDPAHTALLEPAAP